MAMLLSRWWLLTLLALLPRPQPAESRNVTHEDIRDAMLSLIHMFRTLEDKLERHEYREKTLGDQLKKSFIMLEKRHRTLEPVKGMVSRIDERLSNVETILLQKEERERANAKKTSEALEAIQNTLGARREGLADRVDAVRAEVEGLKNVLGKDALRAICRESEPDNPLERHLSETEKLLNKYELKLSEFGNGSRAAADVVPLSEVSLADEAWHGKMTEVLERQAADIKRIESVVSTSESMWKQLATAAQLQEAANDTRRALQQAREDARTALADSSRDTTGALRDMTERAAAASRELERVLTQGNTMAERAYADLARNYDTLRKEVQNLSKSDHVLIQTADNVLATKKRVEFGVHQVLQEVGALVKQQSSSLNGTMQERFDNIQTRLLESQAGALGNLSAKIEADMSQVWRQIGIMYQQLSASKTTLDKLSDQTEEFVNGTVSSMDNVKNKVGLITTRMSEVDENLNYLLGRLALVTQEFNQIKTELGLALDKVKANFITVQSKLEPEGPGPHNITSAEQAA